MFQVKALSGRRAVVGVVAVAGIGDHVPGLELHPVGGDEIVAVGTSPALIAIGVEIDVLTPSETVSRA